METLSVGMYVRTINGKIWVIASQQAISGHRKDIINASFSIIDLIEEEDFVNEEMIVKIKEDKDGKYLVTMNNNVIRNQGIESILTKELMEQMAYKVG